MDGILKPLSEGMLSVFVYLEANYILNVIHLKYARDFWEIKNHKWDFLYIFHRAKQSLHKQLTFSYQFIFPCAWTTWKKKTIPNYENAFIFMFVQ